MHKPSSEATSQTRSQLMSRIRSSDTTPELRLRRRLWREGLRYRLKARTPAGRPDLVFVGPRVAVYVDGCFWHGCPDHYVRPRSSTGFWSRKLQENVSRDRRQTLELEELGWTVLRFWEHEVHRKLDEVVLVVKEAVAGVDRGQPGPRWRVVEVHPIDEAGDRERRTLEALRDPDARRIIEQARSTQKW